MTVSCSGCTNFSEDPENPGFGECEIHTSEGLDIDGNPITIKQSVDGENDLCEDYEEAT